MSREQILAIWQRTHEQAHASRVSKSEQRVYELLLKFNGPYSSTAAAAAAATGTGGVDKDMTDSKATQVTR